VLVSAPVPFRSSQRAASSSCPLRASAVEALARDTAGDGRTSGCILQALESRVRLFSWLRSNVATKVPERSLFLSSSRSKSLSLSLSPPV
jgi:hypothetical protein